MFGYQMRFGSVPQIDYNTSAISDIFEDGSCYSHFKFDCTFADSLGYYTPSISGSGQLAGGLFGSAASFNGVLDHMSFPSAVWTGADMSMSFWATPGYDIDGGYLFGQNNGGGTYSFSFLFRTDRVLVHTVGTTSGDFNIFDRTFNIGEFYHFVFSRSGSNVSFYINGELIVTLTHEAYIQTPFVIGTAGTHSNHLTQSSYHGNHDIDQLRFFNRPITAKEVERLYLEERHTYLKPTNTNDIFSDGTNQWYWNTAEVDLYDEINKLEIDTTVCLHQKQTTIEYNGRQLPAYSFASDERYMTNIFYSADRNLYDKYFTISMFINLDNFIFGAKMAQGFHTTGHMIYGASNIWGLHFTTDGGGSLTFGVYNSTSNFNYVYGTGVTWTPGQTYHIAVVVDRYTTSMKMYVDGVLRGTGYTSTTVQSYYDTYNGTVNQRNGVNGRFANLRIIKRPCTEAEILQLRDEVVL